MKHVLALTFSSLLLVGLCPARATTAGSASHKVRRAISGRITDVNGAVVESARITIVGRSSHITVVRKSNARGEYVADLEPDTYDVTAAAAGFKIITRTTRVLRGSRSYMDFVLYPAPPVNAPVIVP